MEKLSLYSVAELTTIRRPRRDHDDRQLRDGFGDICLKQPVHLQILSGIRPGTSRRLLSDIGARISNLFEGARVRFRAMGPRWITNAGGKGLPHVVADATIIFQP